MVEQPPEQVLEFVMDLSRYRLADHKIGRVYAVERDGDDALVRFRPRFRGLPAPVVRQRMRLTRWSQVEITGAGGWVDRLT
ncbi:MAG: hypothetical protein ACYDAQ_05890, partial [Mycobacteriales bacterium]